MKKSQKITLKNVRCIAYEEKEGMRNAILPDAQRKKKKISPPNASIFLIPDTQSISKSHWIYPQYLESSHFSPLSLLPHHNHVYLEYYNKLLTHLLHFLPY